MKSPFYWNFEALFFKILCTAEFSQPSFDYYLGCICTYVGTRLVVLPFILTPRLERAIDPTCFES